MFEKLLVELREKNDSEVITIVPADVPNMYVITVKNHTHSRTFLKVSFVFVDLGTVHSRRGLKHINSCPYILNIYKCTKWIYLLKFYFVLTKIVFKLLNQIL
jgi:hypothetical protein